MTSVNLSAELAKLQQTFVAALPDKLARLEQLLGVCTSGFAASGRWPEDALRQAHLVVHSLAGSGGTFGLKAMGEAAHALEVLLASVLHDEAPADAPISALIQSALTAVRSASVQAPAPTAAGFTLAPVSTDSAQHQPRLLYLVEDDTALATSLAAQLSHFGYQVRLFDSPGQVAAEARSGLPVAIIMDVGFPEGELAGPLAVKRALRNSFQGVPVLFVSARGDFSARLEAVRAEGVAYFTKPVDIDALVNALDDFSGQTVAAAYRVLIVDDSESTASFYQQVLAAAGMEAITINDASQVLESLTEFAPDMILIDLYMPVCSGIELATLIRQQPAFVAIPIVFLSTETNTNRQLVALRQGGDDFLSKPIDPARLVSVVTSRAQRGRLLRARMVTDGLTGLLNHSHLKEQLATEMVRSQRQGKPLVFVMLDADHFKRVNDTWGHAAGDRVLRSLAKLLRQRLRRTDVVGRYGGEEFGLILNDIDAPAALLLLDAIRRDFAALRHTSGDAEFSVTFSAGIAEFPRHRKLDVLIGAADAALYAAKQGGRDRILCDGGS